MAVFLTCSIIDVSKSVRSHLWMTNISLSVFFFNLEFFSLFMGLTNKLEVYWFPRFIPQSNMVSVIKKALTDAVAEKERVLSMVVSSTIDGILL